jgi:hypothetical protein
LQILPENNGAMKPHLALILMVLLAACGGLTQPFGKDQPLEARNTILSPPWEAMVAAGPGAANDIDLETLNGPQAAPADVAIAETPDAQEPPKAKPTGNEITAVAVVPVQGAAGTGNAELTKAMRQTLIKAGWTVVNAPTKHAITIRGVVAIAAASGPTQKVSLKWDVQTPDGKVLGDVKQANDVPAGSLNNGWGESAGFATEAAATGIYELINKYR